MESLRKLHTHQYLQNGIAIKYKEKLLDSGLFWSMPHLYYRGTQYFQQDYLNGCEQLLV